MDNWKPGVRSIRMFSKQTNPTLKLLIAIANTMKIDVNKLAKNMTSKSSKEYAQKLTTALDREIKKAYETAVSALR